MVGDYLKKICLAMERIVLFLHRIAYYVIGVQANYALAHSTLTIVLTEKKEKKKEKISWAFRLLDSFFRFRRECAERPEWGEIIFFARKKKNTCNFNYYLVNFILITHQFVDKSVRKRERVWKRARMYECFNVGHCYKLT